MIEEQIMAASVPIEKKENIHYITESCLQNEGQLEHHARTLKLNDFKAPINGNMTLEEVSQELIKMTMKVLTYTVSKYLKELSAINANYNEPVSRYFPNIPYKEVTGHDLEYIRDHNYDELIEYYEAHKFETSLSKMIHSTLIYNNFNNERIMSPIKDKTHEEGEKLIFCGYSKRIYMNLPRRSAVTCNFGLDFILKCIDRNIPYQMKLFGAGAQDEQLDGTVFYSKNEHFKDHLEIIYEILSEHPEYKKYLGTSIYTGGQIKDPNGYSYITISYAGKEMDISRLTGYWTYSTATDNIINFTYVYSCCNFICHYAAYFSKKNVSLYKIAKDIKEKGLNVDNIKYLRTLPLDTIRLIRKAVFDFINLKENNTDDLKRCIEILNYHMCENLPKVKSIINFGDLEHTEVPMYKDKSFLIFEQNHLQRNEKKSIVTPSSTQKTFSDSTILDLLSLLRKNNKINENSLEYNEFMAQLLRKLKMFELPKNRRNIQTKYLEMFNSALDKYKNTSNMQSLYIFESELYKELGIEEFSNSKKK